MSVLMDGAVEARRESVWRVAHDHELSPLPICPDATATGCLFGVGREYGFEPVSRYRGLPEDASEEVRAQFDEWLVENARGVTWVGWPEIAEINWGEIGKLPDDHIHEYRRLPDGAEAYVGRQDQYWSHEFELTVGSNAIKRHADSSWVVGQEWVVGDRIYRTEWLTRREAVGEQWLDVFARIGALAEEYAAENVRLIVWFS